MKRSNKALPEVIPPRICVTFRRATFRFRPKSPKIRIGDDRPENTVITGPGSHDNFSGKVKNHQNRSELDPYWTLRAEDQLFWIFKVVRMQWDHCRPPRLAYKNQIPAKSPQTPQAQLSTKFGHQPYVKVFTFFKLVHVWYALMFMYRD